jgi:hypothetical protein
MNLGLYSYRSVAIAYGLFAVLLLFSWRESLQVKLLTVVIASSAVWTALAATLATTALLASITGGDKFVLNTTGHPFCLESVHILNALPGS